ncbi:MAG: DEAD/DEAH box helicase family protein [Opitutales bacterium]|nr:DEAD/DEAH box helicase family protein [Opitutales bacterium]
MTRNPMTYDQPDTPPRMVREQDIEDAFIAKLRDLKYTDRPDIHDRASLEANFRQKFEALNRVRLTDGEFARLLDEIVTPDVFTAAKTLRQINAFTRDDGTPLNYSLVNLKDWCKNTFEVVSQLRINTDYSHHRYDVLLLINGVPCVQIELKTLSVSPRRAMEQIVEYKNDPGNGYTKTLLCFLQLFIVSNRTETHYFANNNARHFTFNQDERFLPIYQFADEANKKITHLDDFASTFLVKCTLGHTISRYMVLIASEQKLLMMRPYQVYAVKHLATCIQQDSGNGFIWHTTGSGKTLTSFKTATLLKDNPDIEKCLFVVDRKDLDRQTREEFNRFQEGCVEENTNTAALVRRLLSEDYADKVIVTTIQKLGLALDETSKRNKQRKKHDQPTYKALLAPLQNKRIAFIFDECHRSQFGENHKAIKEFFPRAQLFGFTGTPIFAENAAQQKIEDEQASMKTTEDLFQKQLHAYTITHAIEDGNVLRFHIDYYKVAGASSSSQAAPKVAGASSSSQLSSKVAGASSSPHNKSKTQEPAPATWEYFNPSTEIDIHTGDLPHWEQGSVWYFVTFRLADALPQSVVQELKEERERWKQSHDLDNLSAVELAEYHRLFSDRYEALLNAGSGSCVLRDPEIAQMMDSALHHFEGQRYELDEYVIMPNHIHVLVKPLPGHRLVNILHSWKSFTANQINKRLGKTGQFWQHESYDHIVRHERAMDAIRHYIRENPRVAGASSSSQLSSRVAGASSSHPRTKELEAPATLPKRAVIEAILAKHDAATSGRRFNALLATASINDAIKYHRLFARIQSEKQAADPDYRPLNIACVFSPPAEGDPDVKQIQEDLPQEQADNEVEPDKKKEALKAILADYNTRYGTNHRISEFDLYYQDVQKRIKDQQWRDSGGSFQLPSSKDKGAGCSHHPLIDITIVVDMLLTGFDSKYLNTLYVDKTLKHHGLIQAFSRTNRVLNGTKPYGNILDFRQQQDAVDAAIALFSGEKTGLHAREIWLVDKAPVVVGKLQEAMQRLDDFMKSQGLDTAPEAVPNLKGDAARAAFINLFKEVQRLKTQLDQYTDLTGEDAAAIEQILPKADLLAFRGQYLETAKKLKEQQGKVGGASSSQPPFVENLEFEFVLFASTVIDYDYIMGLIAKFSEKDPGKSKMSREQLIGLIGSDAKFMNERDDIAAYIGTLKAGEGLGEDAIREGYTRFKKAKNAAEIAAIAGKHDLTPAALETFVDGILTRMIFDGEHLSDLFAPLDLGWKARTQAELALMADLHPLLTKRAQRRDISGLSAYEV